ncbi:hypothetical protein L4C36_10205 [Photobacterium japonica]|uniref:hypothetical protein n=1 Tax=Photobacterium japonica TaxID=2910235 RepID=UPI003D13A686
MEAVTVLFDELSGHGNYIGLVFGLLGIACFWVLPVIVSLTHSPKYTKVIALACVPAFFYSPLWVGLLVFAVTGRYLDKWEDGLNRVKTLMDNVQQGSGDKRHG